MRDTGGQNPLNLLVSNRRETKMIESCTRCKKEMDSKHMKIVDAMADLPTGEVFSFFGPLCPSCFQKFREDFIIKEKRRDRWWEDWETEA